MSATVREVVRGKGRQLENLAGAPRISRETNGRVSVRRRCGRFARRHQPSVSESRALNSSRLEFLERTCEVMPSLPLAMWVRAPVCVCVSLCLCVSVSLCLCASVSLCLCVSVFLCVCVSVSVSMSVFMSCVFVCLCVCVGALSCTRV